MVTAQRMPLLARMAGEIMERTFRTHRLEYSVIPLAKIDAADIASLKTNRYSVEYSNRSELLDIEELTVLAMMIAQQRMIFESGAVRPGPDGKINLSLKVSACADDQTILAVASKTVFSAPRLTN